VKEPRTRCRDGRAYEIGTRRQPENISASTVEPAGVATHSRRGRDLVIARSGASESDIFPNRSAEKQRVLQPTIAIFSPGAIARLTCGRSAGSVRLEQLEP